MPRYDFGDWSSAVNKMVHPSDQPTAIAAAALKDKNAREDKQDAIKNFALYGGYDPEQVMAGAEQVSRLGDENVSRFQDAAARPANFVMQAPYNQPPAKDQFDQSAARSYKGFRDMFAEKLAGKGLSFEQKKELEDIHGAQTRETKATPSGGTVDKYAGMGGGDKKPLESDTSSGVKTWLGNLFGGGKAPAAAGGMIKVRLKKGGQTGSIAENKFDSALYEKI